MKTKAQYKAANANDRVGFGGTINKGCSVPSRRSGNHPLLDRGRGAPDPPFLYPSNPELTKKKGLEIWQGSPHSGPAILKTTSKPTQ